jgi:transcriptional regulator with XRE-family HTH domain
MYRQGAGKQTMNTESTSLGQPGNQADQDATGIVDSLGQQIGQRVKERRAALGLSLRALGSMTHLTASSLSQIERGAVNPTFASLTAIAAALQVPLFELFVSRSGDSAVSRRGHHPRMQLRGSSVEYEMISRPSSSSMAVQRAHLHPGHSVYDTLQSHPQEECVFVLNGTLQLNLGGQDFVMEKGDAIHFDGLTPHRLTAIGDCEAEYVFCISPAVL